MTEATIPANALETLNNYYHHKIPTGGCMEAILSNDLFDAFGRADLTYQQGMGAIVKWIYNNLPRDCYGSREAYRSWLAK